MYRATWIFILFLAGVICEFAQADSIVDSLKFGNKRSEQAHQFDGPQSEVFDGAIEQRARRILPPTEAGWRGERISFKMKVDPKARNYFTAKFWGSETTGEESRLFLFLDGEQIGQRHLGEVDPLDILGLDARFPNRFVYKTLPLPLHLTEGKTEVDLAIEIHGRIWGYGDTFELYQRDLETYSRGIYRCYTHTDPFLAPGRKEAQGTEPPAKIRSGPNEKIVGEMKRRVNHAIRRAVTSKEPVTRMDVLKFLANACLEPWTDAYHDREVLELIINGLDAKYFEYQKDPALFEHEWEGAGPAADAVRILDKALQFYIDENVTGTKRTRREAWGEMFKTSRDWHALHRRSYTNQTMIIDLNTYRCNRAVQILLPDEAWEEAKALRLLHEAVGIEPWTGSWELNGRRDYSQGKKFFQLTEHGLTRELGFVGNYGEIVHDIVRDMYEATRPGFQVEGDPKIKQQLVKIAKARAVFRYPAVDKEGFRCMRLETVVGWRDWKSPGKVIYDQVPSRTGGPLDVAATTGDPALVGYGQQMLEDNQFFAAWDHIRELGGAESNDTLLRLPRIYEWFQKQPTQETRLPMTANQPDFVFADPEIGVVAIKHNDEILYASLYWRARFAINNLSRVHFITPTIERDATVFTEARFSKSKEKYKIPDWTNMGFKKRFESEYQAEGLHLANAGQTQPIAKAPRHLKDVEFGKENIFAGKADLYLLEYGDYFIAMNCDLKNPQSFKIPKKFIGGQNLSGSEKIADREFELPPGQTLVLNSQQ